MKKNQTDELDRRMTALENRITNGLNALGARIHDGPVVEPVADPMPLQWRLRTAAKDDTQASGALYLEAAEALDERGYCSPKEAKARNILVQRIINAKRAAGFPITSDFFGDVWPVMMDALRQKRVGSDWQAGMQGLIDRIQRERGEYAAGVAKQMASIEARLGRIEQREKLAWQRWAGAAARIPGLRKKPKKGAFKDYAAIRRDARRAAKKAIATGATRRRARR
jgi:hypothetical protein